MNTHPIHNPDGSPNALYAMQAALDLIEENHFFLPADQLVRAAGISARLKITLEDYLYDL